MERKFISRLFINKAKESGKTYIKGTLTIKQEDLAGFINSDGDLVVPVFGGIYEGETKSGQQYKAFNLEVIQDEENNKAPKKVGQKTTTQSKGSSLENIPF